MNGLEQNLFVRAANIYSAMKARAERKHRRLPFTLEEFRGWLMQQFSQNPNTKIACVYCGGPVTVADFNCDHRVPLARGGAGAFSNLCICCGPCNRAKGKLTDSEFRSFLDILYGQFNEIVRDDILARLRQGGAAFAKLKAQQSGGILRDQRR